MAKFLSGLDVPLKNQVRDQILGVIQFLHLPPLCHMFVLLPWMGAHPLLHPLLKLRTPAMVVGDRSRGGGHGLGCGCDSEGGHKRGDKSSRYSTHCG